jgi:alpha-mannosidase
MILIEDYLKFRPENEARLRKLIQAEKIDIGPLYVQPDEFLVSGEALTRNLLIGD